MKLFFFTCTFLLIFLPFKPEAQPNISAHASLLDSLLKHIYNDTLPGAAVAVMQDGKMLFEKGYGVCNLFNKEKIDTNTSFNIASLTKQFTAMAILQLAAQHKLSTDDKLSSFFPDMNKRIANAITITNLLTHTSGIIDHYAYTDTHHLKHAHNTDVYNAIKNVDSLYFVPGTQFRYSNTGYCLLALIIEKVSGMSYSNYMEQHIFKPAGMLHTTIWSEHARIVQPATGYEWDSTQKHFTASGAAEHILFSTEGDGGIYTSIHDYTQWLNALQAGKVFSKSNVAKARSIQYFINEKGKPGYGFGWFADESDTVKKVYHSGSNGGFRTYSFTIPQQGFSIVIFSNRADIDVEEVVQKIYSLLHPDSKPFTPIEILTS